MALGGKPSQPGTVERKIRQEDQRVQFGFDLVYNNTSSWTRAIMQDGQDRPPAQT